MTKRQRSDQIALTALAVAFLALLVVVVLMLMPPACSPGPKPPGLTPAQWAPEAATICSAGQ